MRTPAARPAPQGMSDEDAAALRARFGSNILIKPDGTITKDYFLSKESGGVLLRLLKIPGGADFAMRKTSPVDADHGSMLGRMLRGNRVEILIAKDEHLMVQKCTLNRGKTILVQCGEADPGHLGTQCSGQWTNLETRLHPIHDSHPSLVRALAPARCVSMNNPQDASGSIRMAMTESSGCRTNPPLRHSIISVCWI